MSFGTKVNVEDSIGECSWICTDSHTESCRTKKKVSIFKCSCNISKVYSSDYILSISNNLRNLTTSSSTNFSYGSTNFNFCQCLVNIIDGQHHIIKFYLNVPSELLELTPLKYTVCIIKLIDNIFGLIILNITINNSILSVSTFYIIIFYGIDRKVDRSITNSSPFRGMQQTTVC